MSRDSLDGLRAELRKKDELIVRLLCERAEISVRIGKIKASEGIDIFDPARESGVYGFIEKLNTGALPSGALKSIYREIISASRALQAPVSVAYLGPAASFTEAAARLHFGESARMEYGASIAEVFAAVEKGKCGWGVVPIENSAEGSVKATLDHLVATPLKIRGEIYLRITQCLLSAAADPGRILRIYSHPQALAQCRGWIRRHYPSAALVETASTADAAGKARNDPEGAAIGSLRASDAYGLILVAEGIEDFPSNTTRFIVIGGGGSRSTGRDKTSVLFGTRDTPGALHGALEAFASEGINMTRIESHPARDRAWEYLFFVDFSGHTEEEAAGGCLEKLARNTTFLKVLGSYPKGDSSP
ncbi:MAG: prephenate dehydratase [Syntrophales bacterium]|nr:prephenate dehydratase [Syntrophales bacterium]